MTSTGPVDRRVDAALVARGLVRSRELAAQAVREGRVRRNGVVVGKPALRVTAEDTLEVTPLPGEHYVSRGGHKLIGALDALDVTVRGRRCIDLGSSTGGFTQVLLERGAESVTAIDVGTGQLVEQLRADPRVCSLEGTHLGRDDLSAVRRAAVVVADLSFISLAQVMAPMTSLVAPGGVLLPMVKPQFEVGRGRLGKGGVVDDPALHRAAVQRIVEAAEQYGFGAHGICRSPLPGPAGNVEFFIRFERSAASSGFDVLWAQCSQPSVKD